MFSCSCFICFCVFLVSFSSSSPGLLSPKSMYLALHLSTPDLCPFCTSTSLCSGDSPEQRSAATWQWASSVPSLSGDHQWDLHPCACAKLAGGLPQSHTRHYGVCVASPIHLLIPIHCVSCVCLLHLSRCHVQDAQMCPPWVFPVLLARVESCSFLQTSRLSEHSRQLATTLMAMIYLSAVQPGLHDCP